MLASRDPWRRMISLGASAGARLVSGYAGRWIELRRAVFERRATSWAFARLPLLAVILLELYSVLSDNGVNRTAHADQPGV